MRAREKTSELLPAPGPRHLTPLFLLFTYFLLATPLSLFSVSGLYEVRELKPGVFLWMPEDVLDVEGDPQYGRAANAGFVLTAEGVMVINTANSPFHGREILYEIRKRTEQPVRYVVNTDAHGDLMLGNEVFVEQQATIIATAGAQAEMRTYRVNLAQRLREDENWRLQARMRGIHPTPAEQGFDTEMRVTMGGEEIRLIRLSGGHSAGDAVVHLPRAKVIFLGHLFENGFFPRLAASDVHRWIGILKQVESWDVEVFVPAHGVAGGKKELAGFRQFLEWLVNEVRTRIQEGKSLNDVKRELNLTETYRWSARELAVRDVEEVYEQLMREQPSAPVAPGSAPANPEGQPATPP